MMNVLSNTTNLLNSVEQTTPKGFRLEFFFDTNSYFKNTVLTKICPMKNENKLIPEKAIETEIEWYPGKCLMQKLLKKKLFKKLKHGITQRILRKNPDGGKEDW